MIFGKKSAPALSEQDYARTTQNAPDSTSLIPTIKDAPTSPAPASRPVSDRMRIARVDPFSVTRLAFVVSVALMIVAVVAAALFWIVLAATGVWTQINESVAALLSDDSASFDITDYLGFTQMVGGALVLSGLNVIVMTGLATVGAYLYNLAAALLGGVGMTVRDE